MAKRQLSKVIMGIGLAIVLVVSAVMGACAAPTTPTTPTTTKETMHIKFSTWHPPASRECKTVWTPMLKKLKEKSNGRIIYTTYYGGALGKGPEHYDIVRKGLSDIGYFTATWTPGRFPLSDVLSMPVWANGKDIATDIGNAMYDRILYQEFPDVKMIELNGCIQSFLWTNKPVHTLEDVKGLKIRSPGGLQTKMIQALGAEPVFMPLGDVYQALDTGTVDGLVTCPPCFLAFKLYEVAKYGALATFGCVTEGVAMNKDSWKKTPEDLKPVIEEICSNPFHTTGGLTEDVYDKMMDEIASEGVELYKLPPDEAARWASQLRDKVVKSWVKEMEGKGLPGKKTLLMYKAECDKNGVKFPAFPSKWQDEVQKYK